MTSYQRLASGMGERVAVSRWQAHLKKAIRTFFPFRLLIVRLFPVM